MSQHQQAKAVTLALTKVTIDGGTQSRVALNEDVVSEYAEAIRRGDTLPPVVVFHDGGTYWLADGFHRFHAHRAARAEDIDADVYTGTKRDAVLHSVGANANHGLRRSNDDKRRAVQTLLNDPEWSQWSDRQIAQACCVSPPLVASARASVTVNSFSEEPAERRYTTKHGTTAVMNTAKIGKSGQSDDSSAEAVMPEAVESDSTHQPSQADGASAGCNPITTPPETPGPAALVESDSSAEGPVAEAGEPAGLGDDDVPSLESLLEEAQAFNRQLIEQLKAAEANDQVAETLKWRKAYEGSKAEREHAERRARDSEKREKSACDRLRRCGKAVGEDDPRSIPGKVEALVKAAKGAGVWA